MVSQSSWSRRTLLAVLGYEGAGALVGGSLLIAAPDGRLMDMPVDIMHGVFSDFLIPGIILFSLGILNTLAFVAVLRRMHASLVIAWLALGGLAIWFIVDIIILHELHWLHYMWGFPVYVGIVSAIPLVFEQQPTVMVRRALLTCGILSSVWYIVINVYVPMQDSGYNVVTQTVSELSAIGAPTRVLWVLLTMPYVLLYAAFGWGVLRSARESRSLRITGILIIAYCIFNFYWPPMHMRGTEPALTDTMHIVWAMVTVVAMMLMMGFGAAALGKSFRIYTIATFIGFIVFGVLIGMEAPGISANLPTPYIGIWERINMGAFFIWVVVFGSALLKKKEIHASNRDL